MTEQANAQLVTMGRTAYNKGKPHALNALPTKTPTRRATRMLVRVSAVPGTRCMCAPIWQCRAGTLADAVPQTETTGAMFR